MRRYVDAGEYRETSVSNRTRLEFNFRIIGAGSLSGVSMKRLDCKDVEREYSMVLRMARWRVRNMRVLRDW
jgi:hypothetical protein